MMKARISAGWPHDSGHFSFYRQSPNDQRRIPFVDTRPDSRADVAWSLVGIAVLAVGCFLVLGLN
jgi:hypothetical protein